MSEEVVISNEFTRRFKKKLEGDNVVIKTSNAWRRSESAFKVHIANLEGKLVGLEETVNTTKDELETSLVNNGGQLLDSSNYINGILKAKKNLTEANEELSATAKTLEFLKEQYEALKKQ